MQFRSDDLLRNQQFHGRPIVPYHLQPFRHCTITLCLNKPCATVVTFYEWPARILSPEPTAGEVVVVEYNERGGLNLRQCHPLAGLRVEEVDSVDVMEFHGQIEAGQVIGAVASECLAGTDGGDSEAVDEALFVFAGNHGGRRRM